MTIAIYPGSFDPLTMGHVDIVTRASRIYDKIVMAVVKNPGKAAHIPLEKRVEMVRDSVGHLQNVSVEAFAGLTVDLASRHSAQVIIRGLRAVSDFEYEFAMSQMNKHLCADVETVFMMAGLEYQFLSSSMTREVAKLGGNIQGLVPEAIHTELVAALTAERGVS